VTLSIKGGIIMRPKSYVFYASTQGDMFMDSWKGKGWYFIDESDGCHGVYKSMSEASIGLRIYLREHEKDKKASVYGTI
jgi:hypothetical protein